MDRDGDIFFQPRSRRFKVEIQDNAKGTRIREVEFGSDLDSVEIHSYRRNGNFYEIELGFRKPEGEVEDWGGSILVSADGYKSKSIKTNELGVGDVAGPFFLEPKVNNLVILIPYMCAIQERVRIQFH